MVLDSKKWDSDRWDGSEIILGSIPPFFRGIWSNKTSQTSFLAVIFSIFRLLFSQYWRQVPNALSFRKINSGSTTAGTASKIQYLNIIQIFKISKKHCEKRTTCFQTLTFGRNLGFQKSWICQWIFQGFPTPWISHPMDFGFSGRPRERPTKTFT